MEVNQPANPIQSYHANQEAVIISDPKDRVFQTAETPPTLTVPSATPSTDLGNATHNSVPAQSPSASINPAESTSPETPPRYLSSAIEIPNAKSWNNISQLLDNLSAAQRRSGVALFQLPQDVPGYDWVPPSKQTLFQFKVEGTYQMTCGRFRKTGDIIQVGSTELRETEVQFSLQDLEDEFVDTVEDTHIHDLIKQFEYRCLRKEGFKTPHYLINQPAHSQAQRHKLHLNQNSPFRYLSPNGLMQTVEQYPGIHFPMVYLALPGFGTVFSAHTEDWFLVALNYIIKGAPKLWIIIHPEDKEKFEEFVPAASRKCSQFIRHKCLWVPPSELEKRNIGYTVVY